MSFPLNSSNDVLIVYAYNLSKLILMAGSNFLHRCKKYCQVGWWRMEKNHMYLLKHIIVLKYSLYVYIHSYLNRHILSDILKKEQCQSLPEELTNAPPPSRGFLIISPLPGPTRWQIPDKCPGGDGHAWNWLSHYYYHSMQIFLSFHWPRAHHVTCK